MGLNADHYMGVVILSWNGKRYVCLLSDRPTNSKN